jgi:hypothetical protein
MGDRQVMEIMSFDWFVKVVGLPSNGLSPRRMDPNNVSIEECEVICVENLSSTS